ncbi:MAG: YndJ family transporter [Roseiflexaceae bacterium]
MNSKTHNRLRWHHVSALVGALAWLLLLVRLPADLPTIFLITQLLLLAVLVFVPLALGLVAASRSAYAGGCLWLAVRVQPFAAAAVVLAFLLPLGVLAGGLALSWLLFTGIVALLGVMRFLNSDGQDTAELCINVSLLLLPIGGFWLVMARFGVRPLGFGDTIVLLTAVHFHYAGFALLMLAGLAGRWLRVGVPQIWRIFRLVAAGLIAGVPLVALGITFSRLLELLAVLLLASSVLGLALLTLVVIVSGLARYAARVLLAISALASIATMLLAVGYAGGSMLGFALTIPQMVLSHGAVNAFGLVLCGLLAWTIERWGHY